MLPFLATIGSESLYAIEYYYSVPMTQQEKNEDPKHLVDLLSLYRSPAAVNLLASTPSTYPIYQSQQQQRHFSEQSSYQ